MPRTHFNNTPCKACELPGFYTQPSTILRRRKLKKFNIRNQIVNGYLIDPISFNVINIDAKPGTANAAVITNGTCIYSHATMENIIKQAGDNYAIHPETGEEITVVGPLPPAVKKRTKKLLNTESVKSFFKRRKMVHPVV